MVDIIEVKIFRGSPENVESELNKFVGSVHGIADIKLIELTKSKAAGPQILAMVLVKDLE